MSSGCVTEKLRHLIIRLCVRKVHGSAELVLTVPGVRGHQLGIRAIDAIQPTVQCLLVLVGSVGGGHDQLLAVGESRRHQVPKALDSLTSEPHLGASPRRCRALELRSFAGRPSLPACSLGAGGASDRQVPSDHRNSSRPAPMGVTAEALLGVPCQPLRYQRVSFQHRAVQSRFLASAKRGYESSAESFLGPRPTTKASKRIGRLRNRRPTIGGGDLYPFSSLASLWRC